MKPLDFDIQTAREVTGDARCRAIETKARADADAGTIGLPECSAISYWGKVQGCMETVVYMEQHKTRCARNQRKAQVAGSAT